MSFKSKLPTNWETDIEWENFGAANIAGTSEMIGAAIRFDRVTWESGCSDGPIYTDEHFTFLGFRYLLCRDISTLAIVKIRKVAKVVIDDDGATTYQEIRPLRRATNYDGDWGSM